MGQNNVWRTGRNAIHENRCQVNNFHFLHIYPSFICFSVPLLLLMAIHLWWDSSHSIRALQPLICDELLHIFLRPYSHALLVFTSFVILLHDFRSWIFPSNCGFLAFLCPLIPVLPIGFLVFHLLFYSLISTLSLSSLFFLLSSFLCGHTIAAPVSL